MSHEGAPHVINIVQIARKTFFIEESCCWESFACTSTPRPCGARIPQACTSRECRHLGSAQGCPHKLAQKRWEAKSVTKWSCESFSFLFSFCEMTSVISNFFSVQEDGRAEWH